MAESKKTASGTMALLAAAAIAASAVNAGSCSSPRCGGMCGDAQEEGFVPLFNGKDLTGWIGAVDMYGVERVKVPAEDGKGECEVAVLSCFPERQQKDKDSLGNLCTDKEFGNFILRFDFCLPENGNNGLGIRMAGPETRASYNAMCELQLLDDGGDMYYDVATGKDKLKPCQYTGSVYGIVPARRDNFDPEKSADCSGGGSYVKKPGKWNSVEVRVAGSRIQMVLNGVMITDADVSKFKGDGTDTPDGKKHPGLHLKRGRIGWLGHGFHVMWRNIRIKELPENATLDAFCAQPVVHVDAQRGDDSGDGSAAHPYKTAAKAQKAVRAIKKEGAPDGVAVELEGVFSTFSDSLISLAQGDSGISPTAPVVWRAGRRGALLTGACRLTAADFKPVSGAARSRLKPEVQDKVYECDLAKLGVGELKPLPAKFSTWSEMELVSSGRAMTIARYPNSGWLEITNVIDRGVASIDSSKGEYEAGMRGGTFEYPGDAPARWDVSKGVYAFGFWCYDWASDTLRIAKIDTEKKTFTTEGVHVFGIGKTSKWAKSKPRYFVYNLLEELDAPGEWYVDRETRTLYFYPTERGFDDVALSLAKKPLVSMINTANVVVEGLEFKYTTDLAVYVGGSSDVVLDGLSVSWVSGSAVKVLNGKNVTVRNCRMSQIGGVGLTVNGGDRKSLTKCNHHVIGNDIGFCGRLSRIDGRCCSFNGCGVVVERNYFHDTPYITLGWGGNEHLVQYNDIECSMLEAADGGGFYTGRDWGSCGNVVRWNYLHHFGKAGTDLRASQGRPSDCEPLKNNVMVEGIYLDDCDSGETIYGNIFYKAGRALYTGGGRDNKWTHNLVIDCPSAAHLDCRGIERARPGSGIKNGWDLLAKIERFDYTNEPWASRYPWLVGIMDKEPLLPIGTEYVSNVAVNCGHFFDSMTGAIAFLQERAPNVGNVAVNCREADYDSSRHPQTNALLRAKLELRRDDDLSRVAESADPLRLQDTPEFRRAFPDFPRIPVEDIGLRQ